MAHDKPCLGAQATEEHNNNSHQNRPARQQDQQSSTVTSSDRAAERYRHPAATTVIYEVHGNNYVINVTQRDNSQAHSLPRQHANDEPAAGMSCVDGAQNRLEPTIASSEHNQRFVHEAEDILRDVLGADNVHVHGTQPTQHDTNSTNGRTSTSVADSATASVVLPNSTVPAGTTRLIKRTRVMSHGEDDGIVATKSEGKKEEPADKKEDNESNPEARGLAANYGSAEAPTSHSRASKRTRSSSRNRQQSEPLTENIRHVRETSVRSSAQLPAIRETRSHERGPGHDIGRPEDDSARLSPEEQAAIADEHDLELIADIPPNARRTRNAQRVKQELMD
ncbi:hypothetical protein PYCC9005_003162 [Savitreella phatthalungensis]